MCRRDGTGRVLGYSYDTAGHLGRVVADGDLVARIERDLAARTVRARPRAGPYPHQHRRHTVRA